MKNKQLQSRFRSAVSGPGCHYLPLGYTARIIVLVLVLAVWGVAPAGADDTGGGSGAPDPQDSDRIDYGRPATSQSIGETAKQVWASDKLTGDWDGARTDLHDYGIGLRCKTANRPGRRPHRRNGRVPKSRTSHFCT